MKLQAIIDFIQESEPSAADQAQAYIDTLTKPPGSLGRLETIAVQLASMTGYIKPNVSPPGVLVIAADHGIAEEGVSAFPQSVTAQMVYNFLNGGAAINVFAKQIGAKFEIVDVGVNAFIESEQLRSFKVKQGTHNFAKEPAMTRNEALQSIEVGMTCAKDMLDQGVKCLILGEMGIGNTTTSSAMLACLCQASIASIVGLGTGISPDQQLKKQQIIEKAVAARNPDRNDPLDILSKVGGLEIGAMAGAMLYAASQRIPILLDGFICTTAALLAARLAPNAVHYMLAGHLSEEPGHAVALQCLGLEPIVKLQLRLGEGSGAAAAYPIVQLAAAMVNEMATFASAGISNQA